jgi:hypothetical protein
MPAWVNIDVDHKFGDLIMGTVSGKSKIELGYGTIDVESLEGAENDIEIKFSDGHIGFINDADLELQYSDLDISESKSMTIDSKFSDLEIGKVDVLTLNSGYDDDLVGFVRDADVDASFSDVEIRSLDEKIVADFDYGELKVKEVGAGFTLIDITNNYADANIGINPEASFRLVATVKMGDFSYPRSNARISEVELSYTSNKYEGVVGSNENPTAKVLIDAKNGGVNLYYR